MVRTARTSSIFRSHTRAWPPRLTWDFTYNVIFWCANLPRTYSTYIWKLLTTFLKSAQQEKQETVEKQKKGNSHGPWHSLLRFVLYVLFPNLLGGQALLQPTPASPTLQSRDFHGGCWQQLTNRWDKQIPCKCNVFVKTFKIVVTCVTKRRLKESCTNTVLVAAAITYDINISINLV